MGGLRMGGTVPVPVSLACGLAVLGLAGCANQVQVNDLAKNPSLYRTPGYRAPAPLARTVFVSPVQDVRKEPVAPKTKKAATTRFMPEDAWHRPPVVMVDEIFQREVRESGLFGRSTREAGAADFVVEPKLVAMHGALVRYIGEGAAFAQAGLEITVHGPVGVDGKRPVLLKQVFSHHIDTGRGTRGAHVPTMAGLALNRALSRALPAIYAASAKGKPVTSQPASR